MGLVRQHRTHRRPQKGTKKQKMKDKIIFSLKVMKELKKKGIIPLLETDNIKKPGFKCWVYEGTEELYNALNDIMGDKEEY